MKPKISYYLSHPIQYFSPLFRLMAEEFDLHVYYFSDASIKGNFDVGFNKKVKWDIPLLQGYDYTFLKNISIRKSLSNKMWDLINPSLIQTLYKSDSSVVIINGWSYFSNLLTLFVAKILHKEVWLRAENPLSQELKKSRKTLLIKKLILKYLLFPFIDRFLYIGSESKKFFEFYGIRSSRMLFTPYSVENDHFISTHKLNKTLPSLKESLQIPRDKKVILFTGKYISKKRPLDLIKAFHMLEDSSAILVMVGEGQLRGEMEQLIVAQGSTNIQLTGFINQSAISKYYSVADIFVMCSGVGETWGLSVNEAMCFSLPVIVSKTCGCAPDLVQEGVNGFQYEEGDVKTLAELLKLLLSDESMRDRFGAASFKIVSQYSNRHIVDNMKIALE